MYASLAMCSTLRKIELRCLYLAHHIVQDSKYPVSTTTCFNCLLKYQKEIDGAILHYNTYTRRQA